MLFYSEELAIRLHQEELNRIEQRREEETDHHHPPPTTREEYEQIALQGRRQRKRGAGSSRQDNVSPFKSNFYFLYRLTELLHFVKWKVLIKML